MAKDKKSYDTEAIMKEEGRYKKPEPKEKDTGQTRHNRANGKAVGGGKRSGVKR